MSVLNIDLFTPFNFDDLLEEKKEEYKVELDKKNAENRCAQNVLTKRYISLEDLNADNDIPIYFDKKYDKTNYGVLEDKDGYEKQVLTMSPEELKAQVLSKVSQAKKEIKIQAEATQSFRGLSLIKSSVKWNFGCIK